MALQNEGAHVRRRSDVYPGLARLLCLTLVVIACGALPAGDAAAEDDAPGHEVDHPSTGDGEPGHGHGGHGHLSRPDAHAPIGVMGDHTHAAGGFMASYRFMRMSMVGNRVGTTNVSVPEVLDDYMVSPIRMTMDMHMLGLMWAPSNRVTLAMMLPFLSLSMDHVNRAGTAFTTDATGFGDLGLTALVEVFEKDRNQLILNLGMMFPTGSIDRTDVLPSGPTSQLLPYPMQLGSGTWDLRPGLTYNGMADWLSWGAQAIGTIRLGRNDADYAKGDAYMLTGWGAWRVADWMSLSARLEWRQWFDYDGRDTRLAGPPFMVPTADPTLRGGQRLDIGPGVNFIVPGSFARGVRLAFEMLFPVYQDLDGPQLKSDWTWVAGLQYAW